MRGRRDEIVKVEKKGGERERKEMVQTGPLKPGISRHLQK